MSASKPANRNEFKAWCLRKLGEPVTRVNVAHEQVEDCVDQALEFFQRQHYDGSQQLIIPVQITQKYLDDGFIEVDDSVFGIKRILSINSTFMGGGDVMLTHQWQMMAAAARDLSSGGGSCGGAGIMRYASYLQDRNLLHWLLGGNHTLMNFSRHTDRLYILGNDSNMSVGTIIVIDAVRAIIPEEFPQVWNDPFLKKYCTALIKQQWGNNLRKLRNVPLAGGAMVSGEEILIEANDEISELEDQIHIQYQEPPMPMIG